MISERKYRYRGKIIFFMSILAIQMLLITGCGYRITPGGEYIDKNIQTVFVDNLANGTSEANIENILRSAFVDQFIRGGRLKLVDNREKSDAVFKGKINALLTAPLSYNRDNLAAEERMTVTMELVLEEIGAGKIIWTDKGFSATQEYTFTGIVEREKNRSAALIKLSNDSAEKAYRLMMSGF